MTTFSFIYISWSTFLLQVKSLFYYLRNIILWKQKSWYFGFLSIILLQSIIMFFWKYPNEIHLFYALVFSPFNPAKLFKLSPIKSLQVKQFGLYFGQFEHLERLPLAESINLIGLITFSANRLYYFHWICRWQSLGYKAYRFPIINSIFPSDYRKYCLPYQYCQWICRLSEGTYDIKVQYRTPGTFNSKGSDDWT